MIRAAMSAAPVDRPRPVLTGDNAFFWRGLQEQRLLVQRCEDCGEVRHPSMPACPWCQSLRWQPIEVAGHGTVYSLTVVHRPLPPGIESPARIVLVELEHGVRLVAGFRSADGRNPTIGDCVRVAYERFDDDLTLPWFEPETGAAQ
jgi:uncharacterized OB-fold protein